DFRNALLIMTSNIGADLLRQQGAIGFKGGDAAYDYQNMKTRLLDEVKKTFKPEFLNRLDDIVVFKRLSRQHLEVIIELEVDGLRKRLSERDIEIELDAPAKDFLIQKGFDEQFGARPLKRTIQRYLEDPLAEELLLKKIKASDIIRVKVKEGEGDRLAFEYGANAGAAG
ncbi:MAG: AAA family ATPase, partial [Candidatus Omnitrophota bacterium]